MLPSIYKKTLLAMALSSWISSVEAAVSCYATPQCCWVVRIWQLMGKNTKADPTDPTGCCSMDGVGCSGSVVTQIFWSDQRLTGAIPAGIGNLKNLTHLFLDNNKLFGSIPSSIRNMKKLKYLRLHKNRLSGSITRHIGDLTSLKYLYLNDNRFTRIPSTIGNLIHLQRLRLSNNKLTSCIPSSIGNLVNLKWLMLSKNHLTCLIPKSFGNLKNLNVLELNDNKFRGSIPASIGNLTNLWYIKISGNQLTGSIDPLIGKLKFLKYFYVSNNTGLTGSFTPNCGIVVDAANTGITLCGCSSSVSPAFTIPLSHTPAKCLSIGPAFHVLHRIYPFSQKVGNRTFTCRTDEKNNPLQDCMNSLAFFCNPAFIGSQLGRISKCRYVVDTITDLLNPFWQNVRKECGQWPWNGYRGDPSGSKCAAANSDLRSNIYYTLPDFTKSYVTLQMTDSANLTLWSNAALKR